MAEGTITIRDARLIFRNFAGKEGKYNREGDRNFCVLLDTELAAALVEDGWNVKYLKAREEDTEPQPYLQVSIGYKYRPPTVVMITHRGRTTIPEDMIELFDYADIKKVDLIITPYHWNVRGDTGISAYLKSFYATINEDELSIEYGELDEIPARSGRVDEG